MSASIFSMRNDRCSNALLILASSNVTLPSSLAIRQVTVTNGIATVTIVIINDGSIQVATVTVIVVGGVIVIVCRTGGVIVMVNVLPLA
jgi:hypothetical protein